MDMPMVPRSGSRLRLATGVTQDSVRRASAVGCTQPLPSTARRQGLTDCMYTGVVLARRCPKHAGHHVDEEHVARRGGTHDGLCSTGLRLPGPFLLGRQHNRACHCCGRVSSEPDAQVGPFEVDVRTRADYGKPQS